MTTIYEVTTARGECYYRGCDLGLACEVYDHLTENYAHMTSREVAMPAQRQYEPRRQFVARPPGGSETGTVMAMLAPDLFNVSLPSGSVLAHVAGRIKEMRGHVAAGDKVIVELSPYDSTRGRIVHVYTEEG